MVSNPHPSSQVCSVLPLCYEGSQIFKSDMGYRTKVSSISEIMLDSALFSPISDVPISGSVRYRWSRISDWVSTYATSTLFSWGKKRLKDGNSRPILKCWNRRWCLAYVRNIGKNRNTVFIEKCLPWVFSSAAAAFHICYLPPPPSHVGVSYQHYKWGVSLGWMGDVNKNIL